MSKITILSVDDCKNAIASIRKDAHSLNATVHQVAVSTLSHTRDHGDWTLAAALLNALPTGQRVMTLVKWYQTFSGKQLTFSRDKKAGGAFVGKLVQGWKPAGFDIDKAMAVMFGDLETERTQSVMSVDKLRQMIARVANNRGTNPDGSRKVPDNVIALASRLVAIVDESKVAKPA